MADGKIIIDAKIDTSQASQGAKSLKSQAATIAAVYRKQGMSMSDAMKKAWSEIERTTKSGAKNTRHTISKEFEGAAADLKSTISGIGSMLMSVISTVSFISLAKECIELGSAVEEVQNVVDTAFGSMDYKMEEFADKAITSYGISQLAAKKTGSNYMAMARGMGIAEDAASDMAIALTGLSADVASFYNIAQEEAYTKLKSVFTGETETLKDLGVVMTQTNLEQYALTKGIKKEISTMTQAELTTLRYNFVLNSLNMASGDFVRTQDSWANQTRILSEQIKQLGANVGTILTTVLLPAVKSLNEIVSSLVTATNEVVSAINILKGSTDNNKAVSSSASDAADAEYELADGIEAAAEAAKRSRAGFDELNVLQAETTDVSSSLVGTGTSSSGSSGSENNGSDDIPDWARSLSKTIMSLGVTISDVFFEWEDLSGEQIAEKVITGLAGIAGAGLGFMIGGVPGAVKGTLLGVELGVILSSIIFDGDGSISEEEIIKSLVATLGAIGGGIIGFTLGGPAGAAIGATVGLGLSLAMSKVSFDGDGLISKNEFLKTLVSALNAILGGVIGFFVGGPLGAAIGAVIGFGLTFALADIDFGGNGSAGQGFLDDILTSDQDTGGFVDTVKKKISDLGEWVDKKFRGISDTISGWFSKAGDESEQEYVKPTQTSMNKLGDNISGRFKVTSNDIASDFSAANRSIDSGFTQQTKTGVTGLSSWINEKLGLTCAGVISDFVSANSGVSTGFTNPTKTGIAGLSNWISEKLGLSCSDVVSVFNTASRNVSTGFTDPTKRSMTNLGDSVAQKLGLTCRNITNDFGKANSDLNTEFTLPTRRGFEVTGELITGVFSDSKDGVMKDWKNLSPWFERDVFAPLEGGFKGMVNRNILLLNALLGGITKGVNGVIEALNRFKIKLPNWKALGDMAGGTLGFNIRTMTAPQIPYLAQGTVIPPNQEFLAVLGDQKHGTNIEAPLSTIQEAVALVMEDMIQSNIAGHEAMLAVLQDILEAVLGIRIGDEVIAQAVSRYNTKMAVVKGG